jgi:hypothetical protein
MQKQTEKPHDDGPRQKRDALVELGDLLLSSDGTPLEIEGFRRHAPVFSQVFALNVADLLEDLLGSPVSFHRPPS